MASSLLVESVFKRDISLSSLVLCEMRAHNLVIKCPAFKESQPIECKKPDPAVLTKKLKYKIEGFFEAGLIVDAETKEDIELIVDEEHMAAFVMTRMQWRTNAIT